MSGRHVTPLVWLALLAGAGLVAGGGCGGEEPAAPDPYTAWRPLLAAEIAAGGVDRPDDLYKFLYQGVMGPAHASVDSAAARRWLDDEWRQVRQIPPAGRPELLKPLRPDGRLVRVDLVRLRERIGAGARTPAERTARETSARALLAGAFARTAGAWPADTARVADLWRHVVADTALWRGAIAPRDVEVMTDEVRAAGWPAIHHSESYLQRRRPHYRVVDPARLPATWHAEAER